MTPTENSRSYLSPGEKRGLCVILSVVVFVCIIWYTTQFIAWATKDWTDPVYVGAKILMAVGNALVILFAWMTTFIKIESGLSLRKSSWVLLQILSCRLDLYPPGSSAMHGEHPPSPCSETLVSA